MTAHPALPAGMTPGYWMHETSGVLRPAIEAYLSDATMTDEQIAALRAYLRQWIMSPAWDANPHADDATRKKLVFLRRWINGLTSREVIEAWLSEAEKIGIDPL